MQQRAEDSWTRNAQQIAEDVTSAAATIDARLVVVAGDEHGRHDAQSPEHGAHAQYRHRDDQPTPRHLARASE